MTDQVNARKAIRDLAYDANIELSQALSDHHKIVAKLERALEQAGIASRALAAIDPVVDGEQDDIISRTHELEARAQKALFGVPVVGELSPEDDSE